MNKLTRHRANVGAAVTTNFRFITHAPQRHTHILTPSRSGNRATQ
ncbi:Uncharacterised protein [Vibrio cholerae]|nr:Uncharacterised protein [Vibrio cholerae]